MCGIEKVAEAMPSSTGLRSILVTGGNSGIGLALCKILVVEQSCFVYLGSRSAEKGAAAVASIIDAFPTAAGKIEVLQIDVSSDASCVAAAAELQSKSALLYAVVNNAGVGLAHGNVGGVEAILNTNFHGPKRVADALVALVDPKEGRIVNVSSGAASMWLKTQDAATKTLFSNPDLTLEDLDAAVLSRVVAGDVGMGGGYGLSKAALSALTLIQARKWPHLKVVSLSPGFIDTPMTKGFGAKLTPEQGCVSSLKCLFQPVTSGFYYGSDGLRSPLTMTRDPGTPEYQGEAEPNPSVYNK